MPNHRISRRDIVPHSGASRIRSSSPGRRNIKSDSTEKAESLSRIDMNHTQAVYRSKSTDRKSIQNLHSLSEQSSSMNKRLSRRDIFYSPAINRSKSTDRRYIKSEASLGSTDTAINKRLSRRDIFYSPAINRSKSTDRRYNKSETITESTAKAMDKRLSRRDIFYSPAINRSKSTDRRYIKSETSTESRDKAINTRLSRRDIFYSPAINRSKSTDRRYIKSETSTESTDNAINTRLSRRDIFYSPADKRSKSNNRRSIQLGTTQDKSFQTSSNRLSRRDIFYSPAIERSKSTDRRFIIHEINTVYDTNSEHSTRKVKTSLLTNGCRSWVKRLASSSWLDEANQFNEYTGVIYKELQDPASGNTNRNDGIMQYSRKKTRKLMRQKGRSKESGNAGSRRHLTSPISVYTPQLIDENQGTTLNDINNNSTIQETPRPEPRVQQSRLLLMKRIWKSMCCSADQGQVSSCDPRTGCKNTFRSNNMETAKSLPARSPLMLYHGEVLDDADLANVQDKIDTLENLDLDALLLEYDTAQKVMLQNEELIRQGDEAHESEMDKKYERYCEQFQADQEELLTRYAYKKERRYVRAEFANAIISRSIMNAEEKELDVRTAELNSIIREHDGLKDKNNSEVGDTIAEETNEVKLFYEETEEMAHIIEGITKKVNTKFNELRISNQFDLDESVPLSPDVLESAVKPYINASVFLKELDEMFGVKREDGGFKPKVDMGETTHSTEHEYEPKQFSVNNEEATYPNDNEEDRTQTPEHRRTPVKTENDFQINNRAVAFVIDMGSENGKQKQIRLMKERLKEKSVAFVIDNVSENDINIQTGMVKETKKKKPVAFVIDMGSEIDNNDTKKHRKNPHFLARRPPIIGNTPSDTHVRERHTRFAKKNPDKKSVSFVVDINDDRPARQGKSPMFIERTEGQYEDHDINTKYKRVPGDYVVCNAPRVRQLKKKRTAKSRKNTKCIKRYSKYAAIKSVISTRRDEQGDQYSETHPPKHTATKPGNFTGRDSKINTTYKTNQSKYAAVKSKISTTRAKKRDMNSDTQHPKYTTMKPVSSTRPASKINTKQSKYAAIKSVISTTRSKKMNTNCSIQQHTTIKPATNHGKTINTTCKKTTQSEYSEIKSVISTTRNTKVTSKSVDTAVCKTTSYKKTFHYRSSKEPLPTLKDYPTDKRKLAKLYQHCKESTAYKYRHHPCHSSMKSMIPKPSQTVAGAARRFFQRFVASVIVPGYVVLRRDYWRERFVDIPWQHNIESVLPQTYRRPRSRNASKLPLSKRMMLNTDQYRLHQKGYKPNTAQQETRLCAREVSHNEASPVDNLLPSKADVNKQKTSQFRDTVSDTDPEMRFASPRSTRDFPHNPMTSPTTSWANKRTKEKSTTPRPSKGTFIVKHTDTGRDQIGDNMRHEGAISPDSLSPYSPLPSISYREGGRSYRSDTDMSIIAQMPSKSKKQKKELIVNVTRSTHFITPRSRAKSPIVDVRPLPPIKSVRRSPALDVFDESQPLKKRNTSYRKSKSATKHSIQTSNSNLSQRRCDIRHQENTPTQPRPMTDDSVIKESTKNTTHLPRLRHTPTFDKVEAVCRIPAAKQKQKQLPHVRHTPSPPNPTLDELQIAYPGANKRPEFKRKPKQLPPLRSTPSPPSPTFDGNRIALPGINKGPESKRKLKQLSPIRLTPTYDPSVSPLPLGQYSHTFADTDDMMSNFKTKFEISRTPEPGQLR